MIVQPHFRIDRMFRADPVNRALDLSPVRGITASRGRVIRAMDFRHVAGRVFDDAGALDEIRITQTDFLPRREAEIFGGRHFAEIILLDVQLARERHLSCPRRRILTLPLTICKPVRASRFSA